ncbi:MAG: hypothetical protein RBS57_14310 [Desulforhabdus sp.]|nr:hypothetical protein [Desulforhabdus sp.]
MEAKKNVAGQKDEMNHSNHSISQWWLSVVLACCVLFFTVWALSGHWKDAKNIIASDVVEYHSYLPAVLVYHDISMKFLGENKEAMSDRIRGYRLPNGNHVVKMSMGMSLLYAPFYFAGHWYAMHSGYPADGFSQPYGVALTVGSLFYFFAGVILLGIVLARYFEQKVVSLVLVMLIFATNISYYLLREPAMSHTYSFFLFAAFLLLTVRWYEKRSIGISLLLGLTFGLITLVRPTNGLIAIVFLVWNIDTYRGAKARIAMLSGDLRTTLLLAACAFLVWVPQMVYWKEVTGHLLFYSYVDEGFHFLNPKVFDVLFGFRKGWFVYTPVMLVSVFGFYVLFRTQRKLFWPLAIFFSLNIYVISSWWCWWYGGSYGHRAFIESYVVMAFPLAAFLQTVIAKGSRWRWLTYAFCLLFVVHNFSQLIKVKNGALSFDSMTKDAYLEVLWKLYPTDRYYQLLDPPDFEEAKRN